MATASSTQVAASAKAAPTRATTPVQVAAPSRREFLYYIWGASMVMLLGQATAGLVWFALPRFREGEFGGTFRFTSAELPEVGQAPINVPTGRFWLSNSTAGFYALYGVCTHLGCLPKWSDVSTRFECPCHGSMYEMDGTWITGPAPRPLDVFPSRITFSDGSVVETGAEPEPLQLGGRSVADIVDVAVDTGRRLRRPNHA